MRKLVILSLFCLIFAGCGHMSDQSEFWQHETMYKSWDHMWFSWNGYKNPTGETLKKSQEQGWWGIEIPYIPAE
jgi:hypothetical protein